MYALNRYIIKQLAVVSIVLIIVLTILLWLTQSMKLLEFLVDGSADLKAFLQLLSLTIPNILVVVVPIAFGVSVAFVFHKLISERELIVMRASGFDNIQFLKSVAVFASCLTCVLFVLTLNFVPFSQGKLAEMKKSFLTTASVSMIKTGQFNHIKNVTIYVDSKSSSSVFNDIIIYDARDQNKIMTVIAEQAEISTKEDGRIAITAFNGYRQEEDIKLNKISQVFFGSYHFEYLPKKVESTVDFPIRALSIQALNKRIAAEPLKRKVGQLYAEKHNRFATPLYALIFGLGVGYLMIYSSFRRAGQIRQILKAALFVVILQSWLIVQASIIKYNTDLYWLIYAVPISVLILLLFLIFIKNTRIQG